MIIGLTGVAQAGKDTAAGALIDVLRFIRVAFADPLREMLYALNPMVVVDLPFIIRNDSLMTETEDAGLFEHPFRFMRLQFIVDSVGWDKAKQLDEVRQLLQRLGTEAGREVLGTDIWVRTAMEKVEKLGGDAVITDVSSDDEAIAIAKRGGYITRITRPGYRAINAHKSDAGINGRLVDMDIVNDRSEEHLRQGILEAVKMFVRTQTLELAA